MGGLRCVIGRNTLQGNYGLYPLASTLLCSLTLPLDQYRLLLIFALRCPHEVVLNESSATNASTAWLTTSHSRLKMLCHELVGRFVAGDFVVVAQTAF